MFKSCRLAANVWIRQVDGFCFKDAAPTHGLWCPAASITHVSCPVQHYGSSQTCTHVSKWGAKSWSISCVRYLLSSIKEEQCVIQHIFLLLFTGPPLKLILQQLLVQSFVVPCISLSTGSSVGPRKLSSVSKPIIKYISHHIGKNLEVTKADLRLIGKGTGALKENWIQKEKKKISAFVKRKERKNASLNSLPSIKKLLQLPLQTGLSLTAQLTLINLFFSFWGKNNL